MMVGEWQPLTDKDKKVIEDKIAEGHNVLLCVKDIEPNEQKPLTASETENELKIIFWKYLTDERLKTLIIPDIE